MTIREILAIIGGLIIIGIFLDGLWSKHRHSRLQKKIAQAALKAEAKPQVKIETKLAAPRLAVDETVEFNSPHETMEEFDSLSKTEPKLLPDNDLKLEEVNAEIVLQTQPIKIIQQEQDPIDDYIVLTVMAKAGGYFQGFELLQALLKAGLKHGSRQIFHRHRDLDPHRSICFSVASVTKPGDFDIQNMNKCVTKGLTLFMSISEQEEPLNVFELMLTTAEVLAQKLGGTVCDKTRKPLDADYLLDCRQRTKIQGSVGI